MSIPSLSNRASRSGNNLMNLAYQLMETTGASLFLTGKAGTGKTTFLQRLREESSKRIVVLAPTGIAAVNAGGMTIHSFFQLGFAPFIPGEGFSNGSRPHFRFSKDKLRVIRTMDILVIDEISMVRADLLDAVDNTLRKFRNSEIPFGGVQLLLIGDLAQLPPVVHDDEWMLLSKYYVTPYFFSSRALSRIKLETIELMKVYRQDEGEFLTLLNRIRDNSVDKEALSSLNRRFIPGFVPPASEHWIRLVTHNAQARSINDREMKALNGRKHIFEAQIKGDFPESNFPADKVLELKTGCQVMFIKNDSGDNRQYYNGLLGEVIRIDGKTVTVAPADGRPPLEIGYEKWNNSKFEIDPATEKIKEITIGEFSQLPLRKAWAITIHKSQGLTFDRAVIDASSSFTHGQTYVALSRCRTLDGVVLGRPLSFNALICDNTVVDYIRSHSDCAPDADRLKVLQKEYYVCLLDRMFDFSLLLRHIDGMVRILSSDFQSIKPELVGKWIEMYKDVKENVCDVAARFSQVYKRQISVAGSDGYRQDADERIRKGTSYFLDRLLDVRILLTKTYLFHDNKETLKRLKRMVDHLDYELSVKLSLLSHTADNGMKLADHLAVRSKAVLQAERGNMSFPGQSGPTRRKTTGK